MIKVTRTGENDFEVVVSDGRGETRHQVIAMPSTIDRLAPGQPPEAVIEAAFRFLLDREPKESILHRFDLSVIANYFPDFATELLRYIGDLPEKSDDG